METANKTLENLAKLKEMFPEVITESKDENGEIVAAVDAKKLEQLLSTKVIEGDECYDFTWVGKKQAMVEACKPIRKTLRPCREESVDWENTQNLYIEGDNLDVLKLLQESYLNKVQMIYIDPPYNTGNDSFIYPDDYSTNKELYDEEVGAIDESGYRMFKNTETNGRFHSSWCSMMYPRLKLARNLLSEDGVIFISIDDNEVDNMKKICSEIFGENNFVAQLIWQRAFSPKNDAKYISNSHDYILMFAKSLDYFKIGRLPRTEEANARYSNPDNDPRGVWMSSDLSVKTYNPATDYSITTPSGKIVNPPSGRCWRTSKEAFDKLVSENRIYFGEDGANTPRLKRFLSELKHDGMAPTSILTFQEVGHSQEGSQEVTKLLDVGAFDGPKPTRLIDRLIILSNTNDDSIVLDFFSGSATTAHSVMNYNVKNQTHLKFIMVQLPEITEEKSIASKSGYKNICEIGKERIRRAGKKIVEETGKKDLDIGFRVLKLDESNMKDVYFTPEEYKQTDLVDMVSNIKEGRTAEDLLYACMLEWGLELSLPHKVQKIAGFDVHIVNNGDLVACFADKISEEAIKQIAEMKPLRVVFRDSSFATDAARVNVGEIFKLKSPNTTIKVL